MSGKKNANEWRGDPLQRKRAVAEQRHEFVGASLAHPCYDILNDQEACKA